MPTPFESAQLILTLFEQRREPTMRKARDFWFMFNPETPKAFMEAMMGPDGGLVRMVVTYWDMAASLVVNGAIDSKMFCDASREFMGVYAKIEPLLPGTREIMGPDFARHLEAFVTSLPDSRQRIDDMKARMKKFFEIVKANG